MAQRAPFTHSHLAAAALLPALAFATPVLAQFQAPPVQPATSGTSIKDYQPEFLRLEQARDWAGLERAARQALASLQTALGPDNPELADASGWLAQALHEQGRDAESETLMRQAIAICERSLGPENRHTAGTVSNLATLLSFEGRYGEAETLYRRALSIDAKALGLEHQQTVASMSNLALLLKDEGRYAETEALLRPALAITERRAGPESEYTSLALNNLAAVLEEKGRYVEAEPLYRRALSIEEKVLGPESPDTATVVNNLASVLQEQGRYGEAESLARRALAINEKALGAESPRTAQSVNRLGSLLKQEGRLAEAEPLLRRALAVLVKNPGPDNPQTAYAENNLALLLQASGRDSEAEPLLRHALSIDEKTLGPEHPEVAGRLINLAKLFRDHGRYWEADPMFRRALSIEEKALGPQHPNTALAQESLGLNDELQAKFEDATLNLRPACSARSSAGAARVENTSAAEAARAQVNQCSVLLALALWGWSSQGGGAAPADHPGALMLEAFDAGQRAAQSAAGDAMARTAALVAAKSSAVGPEAQAYEAALREQDNLDKQFAAAAGASGARGVELRLALAQAHEQAVSRINQLATDLKTRAPQYWDYRSPDAISVAALQTPVGAGSPLLHDDEALIVFLFARGNAKGLVFAVNKSHAAWAQLGMTGTELTARVAKLRAQIDPQGYGVYVAAGAQNGLQAIPGTGPFDRQAAYELHQALLGDPSIQGVIKDSPVLLWVPTGPLTSLPPGLLVTALPVGSPAQDADPAALRATAWLLRSHAVALLPAVASLRTLRQIRPADSSSTPDPLLAFADPDFSRPASAPKSKIATAPARGFSAYYRDGHALAEALDSLPPLPGTRIEGEALQRALGGRPGSLLTGRQASKAELMARNTNGRLQQVRVLEFATHGLVAGDASDLAEPALVLAAGNAPDDELLVASEAATLKLNADWVLLSACNTASPDAPEAQGLSGLTRAFFYAGARSLLVSHWEVRDDVPPILIPAMLHAERSDPHLSRAQALRQASLAILDDPRLNAAHPFSWAPFTLIGEAGR